MAEAMCGWAENFLLREILLFIECYYYMHYITDSLNNTRKKFQNFNMRDTIKFWY